MKERVEFSRRDFLKGVGLAAGGLGAAALVTPAVAYGDAAETASGDSMPEDVRPIEPVAPPSSWDVETDVIVVGTGGSGGAATVGALEAGARVVTLEKNSIWGGNIQFSGVWGAPRANDPEAEMKALEQFPQVYAKRSPIVTSILAYRQVDDIQWMQEIGDLKWDEMYLQWGCYKPVPKIRPAGLDHYAGKYFAWAFQSRAEELGADIRLSTPATALVQDESGAIVGVIAKDAEGNEISIKAKAVILAAGGYTANPEMLKYYMRANDSYEYTDIRRYCGLPGATGDAARMAQGAGARLMNMNEVEIWDGGVEDEVNVNGPRSFYSGANQLNRQASLSVNILGKRFMNEQRLLGDTFGYQARIKGMQPKATCFTIMDSTCIDAAGVNAHFFPTSCEVPTAWFDDDIKEQIASGLIMQADTFEELAEKMGVPVDTFVETVNKYNAACEAGYDDVFFKDPLYMYALKNPPYFATKGVGGSALHCHGGVAFDEFMGAITPEGQPIPGLYVAGETATYMNGIARVIQSGRYAGQNAAAFALN